MNSHPLRVIIPGEWIGYKPWSINEERSKHWTWRRARASAWKFAADMAAPPGAWDGAPAVVQVSLGTNTPKARRDPHNYTSTVVKAIIDGLVKAGYWPDDTAEYITVNDPTFHPLAGGEPAAIVTITPRSPQ